ncbi:GNAT family N-acetyltransferase [Micromonospora craniellae]|uniref:GNAT family N-acetyltransferase n=1 Tax=Micromonospora craniellae TaxID=2294034 RepID=A0A372FT17_9ACTN|nr:GNAT family N-acetyltransferase [Micromonospora craniellae]QOC90734.1 GNAT family N-acetyltransferase [Micromonospora craniellae]RFS43932.1 GNAT family N-acetyltransferase [Micromonospora craniellae]
MTTFAPAISTGRPEDYDDIGRFLGALFHHAVDPETHETERAIFEPERALLVRDGSELVASAAAYTRELGVPGGAMPAAHVTLVGVAPTHRRQGLLSAMMRRQLREIHDAGREPVAVLWASEGRIYPRFGYGLAAQRLQINGETTELRLPAPTPDEGRLRLDRPADRQADLATVYDRVRSDRPGWSSRDERWWRYVLMDPESQRSGATELRVVLHEGPDGVDGYGLFRTRSEWNNAGPKGVTTVDEVVTATPAAYRAIWRMLLSIDLTRQVVVRRAAVDEPLLRMVNEPRMLVAQLSDALWVRVVDVPAALAARRYATDVDVVIEVDDELLPENTGRWRLHGGPDKADCTRTDEPADLACDVRCLGELFLGGVGPAALAAAGRLRKLRPGALAAAGPAFTWHRTASALEVF